MAKKPFNVRYSEDEMRRIEQATALAGYEHVSAWVRDKSLDRIGARESGINSLDAWVDRQELMGRLVEIERSQKDAHVLLAMLLFLVRRKATTGEIGELLLACENVGTPVDVLAAFLPELAELFTRAAGDSNVTDHRPDQGRNQCPDQGTNDEPLARRRAQECFGPRLR